MHLLKRLVFGMGVLLTAYLSIALIVFFWHYTGAEGYWGFEYLRTTAIAIISVFIQFVALVVLIFQRLFARGVDTVPIRIVLAAIGISILFQWGPMIFVSGSFNDRYKLLSRTLEMMDEGRNEKALELAEKSFEKKTNFSVSPFWFPSYSYFNSASGKERLNNEKYQSAVNYAYCLQEVAGNIHRAEEVSQYALDLAVMAFPNREEYRLLPLMYLQELYSSQGEFQKAGEQLRALEEVQDGLNPQEAEMRIQLLSIDARLSEARGQFLEAGKRFRKLYREYRDLYKNHKSTFYFQLLLKQMEGFQQNGQLDSAAHTLDLLEQVAWRKTNKAEYGTYLLLNARYHLGVGEKEEAFVFYGKALRFFEKRQGIQSEEFRSCAAELGLLYLKLGRQADAERTYNKLGQAMARMSEDSAGINMNEALAWALYYSEQKDAEMAMKIVKMFDDHVSQMIQGRFPLLTEPEREVILRDYEDQVRLFRYVAWKNAKRGERAGMLLNSSLDFKAMGLYSSVAFRAALHSYSKKKATRFDSLQRRQAEITELQISSIGQSKQSQLNHEHEEIKSELRNITSAFAAKGSGNPVGGERLGWQEIKDRLADGEVAVDFIQMNSDYSEVASTIYLALLVTKERDSPVLLELIEEDELEKLIKAEGNVIGGINSLYSNDRIDKLRSQLIDPLRAYLPDSATVYFSPDGLLHQLSWSCLSSGEPFRFRRMISLRSILDEQESKKKPRVGLLVGDPDYSGSASESKGKRNLAHAFGRLEGSAREIQNIDSILHLDSVQTIKFIRGGANEGNVMMQAEHQKDIIHFATHGFFISRDKAYQLSSLFQGARKKPDFLNDPFYRSGLVLSLSHKSGDGLLTAAEVARMNLSKTELVVLSACETGLGDQIDNQGVFGLQRAFKMAGVHNVLMTLWKVDDAVSAEFMTSFYSHYILGDLQVVDAFYLAQHEIKQKYPNPFFWAGYVLLE